MQNIILKNQKQLQNSLPIPQLGSKYSKLANRFSNKSIYKPNSNLSKKSLSQSQFSSFNAPNESKQQIKRFCEKSQNLLQQTQLDYFKQINNQIKLENLHLKQDLKIFHEKLKKLTEEKLKSQQKLISYHKTVYKSQKKISSLMQFAQQLILMVKDRYTDKQRVSSVNFSSIRDGSSVKSFIDPLQMKRIEMQKQMERIKLLTDNNGKRFSSLKKKTIQTMVQQHKAQVQKQNRNLKKAKKSTFYQLTNNKSLYQLNESIKSSQQLKKQKQNLEIEQEQQNQLLNSFKSFEKDVKEIKVLKKLMEGIVRTFNEETQTDSGLIKTDNKEILSEDDGEIMNFVLSQIGMFFNNLIEQNQHHTNPSLSIDSLVVNQKIKPTYASLRLFKSIKEIFDHQIYLLQSQKMHFLQCKNKRLLKFIYECSGCQKYQEMFAQIFRILREGFKQIKWKILPQLKNKSEDQLEIIL